MPDLPPLELLEQALNGSSDYRACFKIHPKFAYTYFYIALVIDKELETKNYPAAEVLRYREVQWQCYQLAKIASPKESFLCYELAHFLHHYQPIGLSNTEWTRLILDHYESSFPESIPFRAKSQHRYSQYILFYYEQLKDSAGALRVCQRILLKELDPSLITSWPLLEQAVQQLNAPQQLLDALAVTVEELVHHPSNQGYNSSLQADKRIKTALDNFLDLSDEVAALFNNLPK